MVTHSSTSRPVQCLCMAERTGCPVFTDLWSYVLDEMEQTSTLLAINTQRSDRMSTIFKAIVDLRQNANVSHEHYTFLRTSWATHTCLCNKKMEGNPYTPGGADPLDLHGCCPHHDEHLYVHIYPSPQPSRSEKHSVYLIDQQW